MIDMSSYNQWHLKNPRWLPSPWISMKMIKCCHNLFHQIPLVTRIQKMYSWPYLGRRVIQTHINHQKESVLTLHSSPMIPPDYSLLSRCWYVVYHLIGNGNYSALNHRSASPPLALPSDWFAYYHWLTVTAGRFWFGINSLRQTVMTQTYSWMQNKDIVILHSLILFLYTSFFFLLRVT